MIGPRRLGASRFTGSAGLTDAAPTSTPPVWVASVVGGKGPISAFRRPDQALDFDRLLGLVVRYGWHAASPRMSRLPRQRERGENPGTRWGRTASFSCLAASGIAVTVATRFGPEELETLLAHVRSCEPTIRLPEAPGVEAILKHFDVRRTDERE